MHESAPQRELRELAAQRATATEDAGKPGPMRTQIQREICSTERTRDLGETADIENPYLSERTTQISSGVGRNELNPAFSPLSNVLMPQATKQEQTQPCAADGTAGNTDGTNTEARRGSRSSDSLRSNGQERTTVAGKHAISTHIRCALMFAATMWFGHKLNASLTVRGPDRTSLNRKLGKLKRLLKTKWSDAKFIAVFEKSPHLHVHVLLFVPKEALPVLRRMEREEQKGEYVLRLCRTDADRLSAMDYATKVSEPFPYRYSDFCGGVFMGRRAAHYLRRIRIGVIKDGKEPQEAFDGPRISLFGFGTRNILEALSPSRQALR